MAAALAKISELEESVMEESKRIGSKNFVGTKDVEMSQCDIKNDNLTPTGEKAYSGKSSTLFGQNNHPNATPSSLENNSSFTTNTISKVKPTKTTTQINWPKDQPREFSQLPLPLSSVFEELLIAGFLKPLQPTPLPRKLPSTHNPNAFCAFHQVPGHATDKCQRLRHEIQNLIDNETILPPPLESSIISNPTAQHKQNLDTNQISLISTKITPLSSTNNDHSQTKSVNETTTQINRPPKQRRIFSQLPAPLSSVYKELLMAGFLKPLQPTPPPQNPPPSYNPNHFCIFHQAPGHPTERCQRLRHEIQDLIDNKTILLPSQNPHTISKPLPNHQPSQISLISTKSTPNNTISNPDLHIDTKEC